uniref:PDZ domain-containing protein n=1 Tax=Syphacia muris TaxID=451379 RepID=A0A0N5AIS2_9BILA
MNIDLGYQNKNSRKYFGFVVGGGKDKDILPFVENVIPGTPAEDAGLKVNLPMY